MAAQLEPLEVLEGRLAQFEAQKAQISAILAADPGNEQQGMQKLVEDLDKVIAMTNALIGLHGVPAARVGEDDDADKDADDDEDEEGGGGRDDEDDEEDDDDLENAASAPRVGPLVEGESIEVASGARVYGGVLVALQDGGATARVKYFEFETEVLLPLSELRRMAPGPLQRRAVRVGLQGECRYATDNKFYPCVVQALTSHGCIVKYTQFGNTEEVPINYLRLVAAAGASSSSSSSSSGGNGAGGGKDGKWKNKTGKDGEARLLPIPDALQIKETDTEEEKARKIKKQRVIRNKNRLVRRDQEQKATQQSWQKFVQKGTKRGIVKESSMFATPDEPTGKVGVVGSGKGVTDLGGKKRPKFSTAGPGEEE